MPALPFDINKIPDRYAPIRREMSRLTIDGLIAPYSLNAFAGSISDDQVYLTVARFATSAFNAGSGNDIVFGNTLTQYIYGGAGNDVINGGGGADYLNGGDGIDTLSFRPNGASNAYSAGVVVDISLRTVF